MEAQGAWALICNAARRNRAANYGGKWLLTSESKALEILTPAFNVDAVGRNGKRWEVSALQRALVVQ